MQIIGAPLHILAERAFLSTRFNCIVMDVRLSLAATYSFRSCLRTISQLQYHSALQQNKQTKNKTEAVFPDQDLRLLSYLYLQPLYCDNKKLSAYLEHLHSLTDLFYDDL